MSITGNWSSLKARVPSSDTLDDFRPILSLFDIHVSQLTSNGWLRWLDLFAGLAKNAVHHCKLLRVQEFPSDQREPRQSGAMCLALMNSSGRPPLLLPIYRVE
jgi:hypothetical protein